MKTKTSVKSVDLTPWHAVFSGSFIRSLCLVVQGFLIARFLGAESFGIFSIALSYVALVFGIVDFRISEAVIKFVTEYRERGDKASVYTVSTAFLVVESLKGIAAYLIILFTGWAVAAHVYERPGLFPLIMVMALGNLFMTVNPTATAFMRIGGHYRAIAGYDLLYGITSLAVIGGLAAVTRSLEHLVVGFAAVGLAAGLTKNILCWWLFRESVDVPSALRAVRSWRSGNIAWKNIIGFSLNVNVAATFRYMTRNLDVLILGRFVPMGGVGVYSLARKMGGLMAYFTDPLTIVIYPEMAREWAAGRIERVRSIFRKFTAGAFFFASIGYIFLAAAAIRLVPLLFGDGYFGVVPILWLLMPGMVIATGFFALYHLMLTAGASRLILQGAVVNFLSVLILVPPGAMLWGGHGAAGAVSLSIAAGHLYVLTRLRLAMG